MKMSTEGLIALVGHEGIVQSRYRDSVGVWTIGVGHTAAAGGVNPKTFTGTLTMPQVIDLLRTDIAKYESDVAEAVKVPLKQHEFDALVSFHFNTGAIKKATLTKTLNAGNKKLAGEQFMNWTKPVEITDRRRAEMNIFLTGKYPAPLANVYPADKNGKVLWGQGKRVNVRTLLGEHAIDSGVSVPEPAKLERQPSSGNWLTAIIEILTKIFGARK